MTLNPLKTIIFDFDGTIADTMTLAIKLYNAIAPRYHGKQVIPDEINSLRKMKALDILNYMNLNPFVFSFIAAKVRKMMNEKIAETPIINGIPELLSVLKKENYSIGIISSNSVRNIRTFLKAYQIDAFDFIFSGKNVFGKHRTLNRFLKKYKLKKEEVVYIGDEIRDIEAGNKAGIKVISVCWGYNDKDSLSVYNPNLIAVKPEEVLPQVISL